MQAIEKEWNCLLHIVTYTQIYARQSYKTDNVMRLDNDDDNNDTDNEQ